MSLMLDVYIYVYNLPVVTGFVLTDWCCSTFCYSSFSNLWNTLSSGFFLIYTFVCSITNNHLYTWYIIHHTTPVEYFYWVKRIINSNIQTTFQTSFSTFKSRLKKIG